MPNPRIPHNRILIPLETRARMSDYVAKLLGGTAEPGTYFRSQLEQLDTWQIPALTMDEAFSAILRTKLPKIFAESEVHGDGSDWNATELSVLGDISVALPVTIFDDGRHSQPFIYDQPFSGTLVFTPGALLCNGQGLRPADWNEVSGNNEQLDMNRYFQLYERRLLPVFRHIDAVAGGKRLPAIVTVPGLGCGQFAGKFRGDLGGILGTVLLRFLGKYAKAIPNVRVVIFDPYNEGRRETHEIDKISLRIRPLLDDPPGLPQLCPPTRYEEGNDDFSNHVFFSIVAWDHVSWPGNDFFGGSRCTDDGVKAAATDVMAVMTGRLGRYDTKRTAYLPPTPYRTWEELIKKENIFLF